MRTWKIGMVVTGAALLGLTGCSTYQYAKDVKMMSFEETPVKGTRVGEIRGADCVWSVMGYKLGGEPTLDKAFANARAQRASGAGDAFSSSTSSGGGDVRYLEQVSTENDGFNAGIVGKQCLVVKGVAFR